MRAGKDGVADQFQRLTDDVVLVIFNKLWDAKLICRCSTICKRFSSLTHLVENLFLSLPDLSKPLLPPKPDSLLDHLNLSRPLSNFIAPRRLHLEFPPYPDADADENDLFIWGSFKSGLDLQCFALLSLNSLCRLNPPEVDVEEDDVDGDHFRRRVAFFRECLLKAAVKHCLLKVLLIEKYPKLYSLEFQDRNKLGNVDYFVSGESVVEKLNSAKCSISELRFCNLRWLRLPDSGYRMEGVTLMLADFRNPCVGGGGGGGCSDAAFVGCFEEEDEIYREAVVEILKNHRDRVYSAGA